MITRDLTPTERHLIQVGRALDFHAETGDASDEEFQALVDEQEELEATIARQGRMRQAWDPARRNGQGE